MPETPEPGPTPAAEANISLSQAVLAPLDAIFKAQLHAARSFLNMLLQLGYPHQSRPSGEADGGDGRPYTLDFLHELAVNGVMKRQRVSIPALALVPVAPLAVEAASFKFEMAVKEIALHRQLKVSEKEEAQAARPWFLVHEPVSIRGTIAPPTSGPEATSQRGRETTIQIEVKVGSMKVPAGLDRLLTSLTQRAELKDVP